MTPDQAAWVRANVWTAAMRREETGPAECACRYGPTGWCKRGSCGRCHAPDQPIPETWIVTRGNDMMRFPEPFKYPLTTATGAHPTRDAMVWLADRVCRWRCRCECHASVQLTLFEGAA